MDKGLLQHLQQTLDTGPLQAERIFGGDINETWLLHDRDRKYFLKLNEAAEAGMFNAEKRGLELLRNTGAIAVPQPLLEGSMGQLRYLLAEYIEKGQAAASFWFEFSRQLSNLHRHTSERFGLDHDNYIGSLSQRNTPAASWSAFYAEHRILYMLRLAFDQRKCDSADTRLAERVCARLDSLFPQEPPALLHGDLWSGNYLVTREGQPCIFDPAVYYGHREMDLGMSLLFGGFDRSFYDHYNEHWPMEKGWRDRVPLAQLYPLLVHLVLFGGHYHQSVREVLKKYG